MSAKRSKSVTNNSRTHVRQYSLRKILFDVAAVLGVVGAVVCVTIYFTVIRNEISNQATEISNQATNVEALEGSIETLREEELASLKDNIKERAKIANEIINLKGDLTELKKQVLELQSRTVDEAALLKITRPENNAEVSPEENVSGTFSGDGKKVYIIVTDPLGTEHLMDPVRISGKTWQSSVFIGSKSIDDGRTFYLKAVAVNQDAVVRDLSSIPGDAIYSIPVKVKRRTSDGQ